MSDLTEARKALAEGRREDALAHAWNAARRESDNERDLKEVARLADELRDAPLAAAVAVRRLRGGAARMSVSRWSANRDDSIVFAIGFLWWLGWSSLIAFAFIDDALLAMVAATAAAVLMMVALTKGWIELDD